MGVYNPYAEMPKNCVHCSTPLKDDKRQCDIDGHTFEATFDKLDNKRDERCPLIEIKPPHGELIDRSELEPDADWYEYEECYTAVSMVQIDGAFNLLPAEYEPTQNI